MTTTATGAWSKLLLTLGGVLLACALMSCSPATEDPRPAGIAGEFHGEHIRWIVPYSPGGGYDEYARLLAPFLERATGARVDIVNLPGAGGMRGANELFLAPKNGLTIGMINGSALIMSEIAGISGAGYRFAEFAYLGRIVADVHVFAVSKDSEYFSAEDLRNLPAPAKIGATGLGGSSYVDAVLAKEAFGLNLSIIHGFDSSSIIRQAMLRGDVVGTWGSWGSALDFVDHGAHRVILQTGQVRQPELADVSTTFDLIEQSDNPERTRKILEAWEALLAVGRPVAAPPGTPADRVKFLSDAFSQAMNDPEFLELARKSNRPLNFASDQDMHEIVRRATQLDDEMRALFVRAIRGEL